jgi:hypothetical protein
MSDHRPTPDAGRYVTVDLDALTSEDVRTLLAVVLEREAKQLQKRSARLAKANALLSHPTLGAYRNASPEVHRSQIEL